ncbi:hypothetical protein LXL04_003284 [Taraxacum kok-saghyz]
MGNSLSKEFIRIFGGIEEEGEEKCLWAVEGDRGDREICSKRGRANPEIDGDDDDGVAVKQRCRDGVEEMADEDEDGR